MNAMVIVRHFANQVVLLNVLENVRILVKLVAQIVVHVNVGIYVVFQLPVIAFFLGKLEFVTSDMLSRYRRHAFIVIMLVAAIITPPDLMTLILVTIPLYLLYEVSIRVVKWVEPKEE